jgi:hypothetical protein
MVAVASGAIGTAATALTASTVLTVTFAEDLNYVEVISDGTAAVWWTADGTTDPAAGTGYYIPATAAVDRRPGGGSGLTTVKLFSTGTPTVRVQRGD